MLSTVPQTTYLNGANAFNGTVPEPLTDLLGLPSAVAGGGAGSNVHFYDTDALLHREYPYDAMQPNTKRSNSRHGRVMAMSVFYIVS